MKRGEREGGGGIWQVGEESSRRGRGEDGDEGLREGERGRGRKSKGD